MSAREQALAAARSFLGTPYRHQGSRRGVGCDCLGLVRGVWRELFGREPEAPVPYTPDWAESGAGDPLMAAARHHFQAIPVGDGRPGDLVLFRWRDTGPARHCGILDEPDTAGPRLIHAYEGASVVSSPLTPGWAGRIAGTFRFPDEA
ncbi:peptidase P60 [Aureimonas flava]|uniref:Peptidase P60 n=1 Tax=Aureimonas flava TaxID=2320271 RepID=A0A3A1WMS5_9HYPH|nr:NlpC/P60 family protein [Aureimonas flava]RIY01297.1 peptidase P60 [Aureimonas flava]